MRVALIGCSASKLPGKHKARDLYTGDLFKKSVAYAEATCDRWLILSAFYGLLDPDRVVESYDLALGDLSFQGRCEWGAKAKAKLLAQFGTGDAIVLLAGRVYRDSLDLQLEEVFSRIDVPLEGLGIGEQKAELIRLVGGAA